MTQKKVKTITSKKDFEKHIFFDDEFDFDNQVDFDDDDPDFLAFNHQYEHDHAYFD